MQRLINKCQYDDSFAEQCVGIDHDFNKSRKHLDHDDVSRDRDLSFVQFWRRKYPAFTVNDVLNKLMSASWMNTLHTLK